MKTHLWVLYLLGVVALAVAACGGKESKAATPTTQQVLPSPTKVATATPTVQQVLPSPTKIATATPSLTPKATATAQGLPFSEVKFKSGDWAKYQVTGTAGEAAAGPPGTMTIIVVEIAFGGTTYEGYETALPMSAGIPGQEVQGTLVAVFLTEKGKTGGKAWNASIATIFGPQLQCSAETALSGSTETTMPQGVTFTTDTYKVPEGGKVIKVWKYRADEGEVWFSNEVPRYIVKSRSTLSEGQTTMGVYLELLAYGSGAPLSVTSAALEASCK